MRLIIIISVLLLIFISGCQEKTFTENNFLQSNLNYEFSLPEKWKSSLFDKLDRTSCDNFGGSCVSEISSGYYELTCDNYPHNLCPGSLLCEVTSSQCDNAPQQFECGCEDLISDCGDGVVETNEECELPNTLNNEYCPQTTETCNEINQLGTRDPFSNCNANCLCNNEGFFNYECNIETCGAQCEQGNLNGETCITLGYDGGTLTCLPNCILDTSYCYYENNDVEAYCSENPGLDCGNIFLTTTCENYLSGICWQGSCFVDPASFICGFSNEAVGDCYCLGDGVCHDNFGEQSSSPDCEIIIEGYNICNINGECVEVPGQGSDQCSSDNDCIVGSECGNGIVQPYLLEECDSFDLNGESCFSLGYFGGSLSCNGDCTFNQNNCY